MHFFKIYQKYYPQIWILIALLFQGCAEFQPEPLSPSLTALEFSGRNLSDLGLRDYLQAQTPHRPVTEWPIKSWNLETLQLVALYFRPEINQATASLDLTCGQLESSQESINPTIAWNPQYDSTVSAPTIPWTLGWGIDFTIETAGKKKIRKLEADARVKIAKLNLQRTIFEIQGQVRQVFFDLSAARLINQIFEGAEVLQSENFETLKSRLRDGTLSGLSFKDAEAAMDRTRLLVVDSTHRISMSESALAASLGLPSGAAKNVPISFPVIRELPVLSRESYEELRSKALLSQPNILMGLQDYVAAEARLRLEIAKQYPDLHLGPGYCWDQGDHKWSIGFSFTLPLLNQNQGAIAEAEAQRKLARANFIALQSRLITQVDNEYASYRNECERFHLTSSLQASQQSRLELVSSSSIRGELKKVALLNASLELDFSKVSRIEAWFAAQQALGTLEASLQTSSNFEDRCLSMAVTHSNEKANNNEN